MAIRFTCPCGQKLKAVDEAVGKRARCSKCNRWLLIPQSQAYDTLAAEAQPPSSKDPHSDGGALVAVEHRHAHDGCKGRILVADGDADARQHLEAMLQQHGYQTLGAGNGEEAVAMIREHLPDAAIIDVKLDIHSGFQVITLVRDPMNTKNNKAWTTPFLMTCEKPRGRDKQYALSLGVHGCFEKPVAPAEICPRLARVLERKHRA